MRTNVFVGALVATALVLLSACGGGSASLSAGVMPPGGTFTGVWFSPQYGEMHMLQTGNGVIGEYRKDERAGRIQGTAQGDLMRFEWTEERQLVGGLPQTTRGRGYFRYTIDQSDKHTLLGEWGIDDDETGGGDWNAYKLARRRPELSTDSSGGVMNEDSNDNGDWDDADDDEWNDDGDSSGGSGGSGGSGTDLDDLDL